MGGCPAIDDYDGNSCDGSSCWAKVRHFPTEDCSGDADAVYDTAASWDLGCHTTCIEGVDESEAGCKGNLEPGDMCVESLLHAGWECYDDVMWAKNTGIHQHPEWYPDLSASSSIEDFHRYIANLYTCSEWNPAPCARHYCLPPCYRTKSVCSAGISAGESDGSYYSCGSGSLGFSANLDACTPDGSGGANLVTGSSEHYLGSVCPSDSGSLTVTHFTDPWCSSFAEFTSYSVMMDGDCSRCCSKDGSKCDLHCKGFIDSEQCHHVAPDSDCAAQLRWAMTEGITNHPEWYGGLNAHSHLSHWQRYLSGLPMCSENGNTPPCYAASEPCPVPCPSKATSTMRPINPWARR